MRLGYGLFLHFGPNTFTQSGWGDGRFPPAGFAPAALDCTQWAGVAAEAGMRYAVLTAKHHDGFCLWPSRHTDYSVAHSPGRPDVVRRFADAFRKAGLQVGLYYSLWDRHCPFYEDDAAYAEYLRRQIEELLADYGPLVELWFDGGWDKEHPTRQWAYDPAWERTVPADILHGGRWRWKELYRFIHERQPDCLVLNNSSSDRPGWVRYHPVDARTCEHFHFVYRERLHEVRVDPHVTDDEGRAAYLPLEFCTSLNPDWFWIEGRCYGHASAETIRGWRETARRAKANLLLNAGPDRRGLIPEYHARFLREAAPRPR